MFFSFLVFFLMLPRPPNSTLTGTLFPYTTLFRALMMPVIILGGIYGGVFTPTEASAVSVMYALTVGIFLYREINYANFMKALQRSVVSTSIIKIGRAHV